MKTRVSLSLDPSIIKEIDGQVDGIVVRSRSDAIEKILKRHLLEKKTAVILAGGDPRKLFVKELGVYRPLVSIGKRTLIEDTVLKCRTAGFVNIYIIGSPILMGSIYEVLGNGEKYGVRINYVEEDEPRGSAKTLSFVKKFVESDFLFLPCDHFFDFDLKKLYDFHLSYNGIVTLAVHTRTSFKWNTSIVEMDGYKIINYEEFPKKPKTHLVSVFIGFMKKDVFNFIPPGDLNWSLQENLFPKLAREGKIVGYPIAGNWVNVHSKNDVKKVINIIKNQK